MIPAFSNITDDAFHLLENILSQPDSVPADFFFDDPTVDGQLELLLSSSLAEISSDGILSITELGRAALKEFDLSKKAERHRRILNVIQFVVPPLISLSALVVSIIALVK